MFFKMTIKFLFIFISLAYPITAVLTINGEKQEEICRPLKLYSIYKGPNEPKIHSFQIPSLFFFKFCSVKIQLRQN